MGTTCSSGLNNLLQCSAVQQTTLPSWYTTAQQNIIGQAGAAASAAPTFANTTSQNAVNTLNDPNNAFKQSQGTLNAIATGAANPWLTCATTGQVTPNTQTALGGLFAAQRQQLCQLLPQTLAPVQASAIGSGNFGSLRGQTAVDTAKTNAFDTLAAQQMQSALQNQSTGATAASSLGNVGAQCLSANLTTGAAQTNAPFQTPTNYANLINAINAPATVTGQTQGSALGQLATLGNAITGGVAGLCGLMKTLGVTGGLAGVKCWFKSSCGCTTASAVEQNAQNFYGPTYNADAGWSS
jgi:hypothetical protein